MILISNIALFQGGGIKGIAYIGAIKALSDFGIQFTKAAGTSVGSIIGSLVACGYTPLEMLEIIYETNLTGFLIDEPLKKSLSTQGKYSIEPLEQFIEELLLKKNKKLYKDIFEKDDYKLRVVATDLSKMKKIVFPDDLFKYNYYPHLFPIARSVAMSSAFPGYFRPIELANIKVLDGGIVENIPNVSFKEMNKDNTYYFAVKKSSKLNTKKNVILINTKGFKTLDFKISNDDKKKLLNLGYEAGVKFINKNRSYPFII